MNPTPSSELSVYFDAPILIMASKTPTVETPPRLVESPAHDPELLPATEPGPVGNDAPVDAKAPVTALEPEHTTEHTEANDIVEPLPARTSSPSSSSANKGHVRGQSGSTSPSIAPRSVFTNVDGNAVAGSTFIAGAGTTGPLATAEANESLHAREASADAALSEDQKAKVARSGSKSKKQLTKIIKAEAKTEKKALNTSIKELAELQKIQKTAAKREEKAQTLYNKTLTTSQKHEAAFMAARAKFEASQALLTSHTEALDVTRNNAREATSNLQEKSQEVDGLRKMFDVDEKEREVKIIELTGKPSSKSRLSTIFG